ncbi:ABC transporter family substrate-binding protein [Saccharomonospora cyanea]|uniref:ABC-type dipeptide transport system, periplasmic component n=1 Tax=Saccharomonospora cyanea NA-134 TaxID=882082 RepID=H5XK07_9PSEU|nr:ABC transporter family substrate-binding protein [Saccharomonospora cyanea]EHR62962.1 ABC-type dipeptide transport system, periplasmic component [Saccharomonospora cyanea NA-134]
MRADGGRAWPWKAVLVLVLVGALCACSNTPPPPVVSSSASSPPPVTETPSQIVAAVDDIVGGYNPHTLADASTVTTALSQLLLPSVFRTDAEGEPRLDDSLMTSAEVTSEDPFTVEYRIRPEASWSDGAPIAVEDFSYLAEAMRSQPGVANSAGYELISSIEPGEGGKLVRVIFTEPYPGWKTLFSNLLPAHVLKDAPGGWQSALADSFPAYGGPFAIKTIDTARGEIVLERNERYWEKPAAVDRIVLQRADGPGMVSALRSGSAQFVLGGVNGNTRDLLSDLGDEVGLHSVAQPYVVDVVLRPVGPALADDKVREAVAALIDRNALIDEGAQGGDSAKLRASAQVLPPSAPEYAHTIPGAGPPLERNTKRAYKLLAEAGYEREAGSWVDEDGRTLSLVVASPGQKQPYQRIAQALSEQLIAEGIDVTPVQPPSRELFGSALAAPVDLDGGSAGEPTPVNGQVGIDIAVIPRAISADPATTAASWFGCATDMGGDTAGEDAEGDEGAGSSTSQTSSPTSKAASTSDTSPKTSTTATTTTDADSDAGLVTPANPAGFCDPELQSALDAALTGEAPLKQSLAEVEPEVWDQSVSIPLFQLADTLALGSGVSGVTPGPSLVGPFSAAVNWTRAPR